MCIAFNILRLFLRRYKMSKSHDERVVLISEDDEDEFGDVQIATGPRRSRLIQRPLIYERTPNVTCKTTTVTLIVFILCIIFLVAFLIFPMFRSLDYTVQYHKNSSHVQHGSPEDSMHMGDHGTDGSSRTTGKSMEDPAHMVDMMKKCQHCIKDVPKSSGPPINPPPNSATLSPEVRSCVRDCIKLQHDIKSGPPALSLSQSATKRTTMAITSQSAKRTTSPHKDNPAFPGTQPRMPIHTLPETKAPIRPEMTKSPTDGIAKSTAPPGESKIITPHVKSSTMRPFPKPTTRRFDDDWARLNQVDDSTSPPVNMEQSTNVPPITKMEQKPTTITTTNQKATTPTTVFVKVSNKIKTPAATILDRQVQISTIAPINVEIKTPASTLLNKVQNSTLVHINETVDTSLVVLGNSSSIDSGNSSSNITESDDIDTALLMDLSTTPEYFPTDPWFNDGNNNGVDINDMHSSGSHGLGTNENEDV